uniref:Selenoprotein Pb-like n=2 Tax=Erpetoichthys calabaricus TaxID=27687 RepID=A0A8C4X8T5_ERPCA
MQASRLEGLRERLFKSNISEVAFLIVNEKSPQSRAMYWELKRKTPEGIPVYQQSILQQDVWETLEGDKDDFLIYDRCGKLTFHVVLPYSYLHYPYVEAAIRVTYLRNMCGNCSLDSNSTAEDNRNITAGDSVMILNLNITRSVETASPDEGNNATLYEVPKHTADVSQHHEHDSQLHHVITQTDVQNSDGHEATNLDSQQTQLNVEDT